MVLSKAEWSWIAKTVDYVKRFGDRVAQPYSMGVIALEFVAASEGFYLVTLESANPAWNCS
jgi:hypothetical protein